MNYTPDLLEKAEKIKLLLLDVDGVLTDGTLLYTGKRTESKAFHTQDGFGLRLLSEAGVDTGIITARRSRIVTRRAEELHIRFLRQQAYDKLETFEGIVVKAGLSCAEVAYMGDDWLDLPVLTRVGLAAAPANAVEEVSEVVHYTTRREGGKGAVREVCDLLLTAKGVKDSLLAQYK